MEKYKNNKETKGIILAAGEGKRLRPLTEDRPKSMIEFGKMTLLQRQINLSLSGIEEKGHKIKNG